MSQSTTIYRISKESFEKLKALKDARQFNFSSAKSDVCLMGSFMGLEYILLKGMEGKAIELVQEIFSPRQLLGEEALEGLDPEEMAEFYEQANLVPYIEPTKIAEINQLLSLIGDDYVHANYDAGKLNENGIYPAVWHNDNSPDMAYNERQLQEDFEAIKDIFRQATKDNDYLLVFTG